MTESEAIVQLNFDMEMIRFNPETGETLTLEQIKARNEDNYKTYLADEMAITALTEIQQYRALEQKLQSVYGEHEGLLEIIVNGLVKYEGAPDTAIKCVLLTDADVDRWEAYKAIGTVEEFKALKEKLQGYKNQMSIYAEQHKVILASDVLDMLEELDWSE